MARLHLITVLAALAWSGTARAQDVARLVIVIGNNQPADPSQPPLRFADDDAIRTFLGFEGIADARVLLTRLDRESWPLSDSFPTIAAPTLAELRRSLQQLRGRAADLRMRGRFVEFYFFFAGHGGRENGAPYLAFEDGRLGRDELERLLLAGNPADLVHVVIDSCQAASFVEGRGPLNAERQEIRDELQPFGGLVERHPRAGFVVTAASGGSAFEWSRFGSGVASHLIRSALAGAADVAPPDGRVSYDELAGFLRTATQDILLPEYQQEIRVIAPRALPSASIIELPHTLWNTELILDRPGRYTVRDETGRRVIDLRHGAGRVRLVLPPYSRRFMLVERQADGRAHTMQGRAHSREEWTYEFNSGQHVAVSDLTPAETSLVVRGLVDDTVFEALFTTPFDASRVIARSLGDAEEPARRAASPRWADLDRLGLRQWEE